MGTGVYNQWGQEISQESIDFWCNNCHYPPEGKKCDNPRAIQFCFKYPDAHTWHLAHECPFAHRGLGCHCNDFPKSTWGERDQLALEELDRLEKVTHGDNN